MDVRPTDQSQAQSSGKTESLDQLRKELDEAKKREAELKATNAELEQIIKDIAPILKKYTDDRVGFLNDRRRLGCYHEEATRRVKEQLGDAGVGAVETVVDGVEGGLERARIDVEGKGGVLAAEAEKLAEATAVTATTKDEFDHVKGHSKWLGDTLKWLDGLAQAADRFEKAGKLKAAYALLIDLDAGLEDLEDDEIPEPAEFETRLLAAERAFTAATRARREQQATVDQATSALATAQSTYDQLQKGRQAAILEQLDGKAA